MSYDAPPPPPPPYGQPPGGYGGYGGGPGGGGYGGYGPYMPGNAGDALRGASLPDAYRRFWSKYAVFTGRASRSEFWFALLANAIVSIVLGVVFGIIAGATGAHGIIYVSYLYSLAALVPNWAVGARRLHDTGRTGWWQLLQLIPCVGTIILIVWWAMEPKPSGDRYNNA